jgi:hypothetical protein
VLGRVWKLTALCSIALVAVAAPAIGQEPFAPYDGSNPFNCELQDVGTGTDFPDPDADPFCVKFDKTNQSLLPDAGLIDFLANEPARVAAAAPKCFYYQRDHWTGAMAQGQPPELWNWVGGYFFDKAKGIGGVHARDLRVLGQPMDATPYAPEDYQPFLEEDGGGGVMLTLESEPDPSCVERVSTPEGREEVYRDEPRFRRCVEPGGKLRGRWVGKVRLRMKRERVIRRLGEPRRSRRGVDRWCVVGAATLRIAYRGGRAALVRSSSRGHAVRGIARGDRTRRAVRRLALAERFRLRNTRVMRARRAGNASKRRVLVGLGGRRVQWIALADPRLLGPRQTKRAIRRSR